MENFEIPKTKSTPSVFFNKNGILMFAGNSYPEDAASFYIPLLDVIKEFAKTGNSLQIVIELIYINTASSKFILDMLKAAIDRNITLNVVWSYEVDDEDMEELGYYYEEILDIKFEHKVLNGDLAFS